MGIEDAKTEQSNKYSEEWQRQVLSMLERLVEKKIQKVEIVKPRRKQGKPIPSRSSSGSATSKPDQPNISIKNPFDRPMSIRGITLIPDSSFKTKGNLELHIAQAPYLGPFTVEDFTDIDVFNVPLSDDGYEIPANETVDIYLWSSDGTDSAMTAVVYFED